MKEQSVIRTAAVMYADETQIVNLKTIHRKIVESIFVDNNNAALTEHQIIDYIQKKLELVFDEKEIKSIVNDSKKGHFEVKEDSKTKDSFICLSQKRFEHLENRVKKYSIENYIQEFVEKIYKGILTKEKLGSALYRFIYELLNKNISAFKKITSAKCRAEEISINSSLFSVDERIGINEFLNWDNIDKNRSLFTLISYSVEYSLLSNNIDSSNILLQSFRNKIFYLDNNVIYRAIGINGEDRQNRILTFLRKCKESGQKFVVSKYTITEFKETIKHHISQLQKVPFGKINPFLFRKYAVSPSFYEFYHLWRKDRTIYGFDLFNGYIHGLYKDFIERFSVEEDYKIPFNERDEKILKQTENYRNEIKTFKRNGREESHLFDAQNTFLVEKRRGANNISITDTKYYFVSTDQKLRNWDFKRNDCQPIALLPSQWMAILLKYFSRTDDDFKSFVSFLRLNQEDPIIQEDKLQIILAGISEITEDFENQSAILERMAEVKFEGILDSKNPEDIREKAASFTKAIYDKKIQGLESLHGTEIENIKQYHLKSTKEQYLEFKTELINEIKDSIVSLENSLKPLKQIITTRLGRHKFIVGAVIAIFYLLLGLLTYNFGWNTMEPIIYFFTPLGLICSYLYLAIKGQSFNPVTYFKNIENALTDDVYKEYNFDIERLNNLYLRKAELEKEIQEIENKKTTSDKKEKNGDGSN